jgi:catechol 2,3-dioxygenase-like lactoylglutathione lyase family enzyme
MTRVTGLGGVFFKAEDMEKLGAWYERHLGIKCMGGGGGVFFRFLWREAENPRQEGETVWAIFPRTSRYFDPSTAGFMLNYRVKDLDAFIELLQSEGVTIDPRRENDENGRFAWIMDPEGNRIELWEPPKNPPQKAEP